MATAKSPARKCVCFGNCFHKLCEQIRDQTTKGPPSAQIAGAPFEFGAGMRQTNSLGLHALGTLNPEFVPSFVFSAHGFN